MSQENGIEMMGVMGSSSVLGTGHDAEKDIMYVQYKNKSVYAYENVSEELHGTIMKAKSIGSAISKQFRGKTQAHPCKQIKVK